MNQEKGLNAKQVPYMDARERVMGYTQFLKRYWAWENGITLYKNPENHSGPWDRYEEISDGSFEENIIKQCGTKGTKLIKCVSDLSERLKAIIDTVVGDVEVMRPEWNKLYRILQAGDMVVFDSVSRMSRNAEEGFSLYEGLYNKGIRLVFLKEHHIDTETYKKALSGSIAMTGTSVDFILKGINEYLMALAKEQIKLAFEQSEKEVADLHQRTREGLLTAKLNGKQIGRRKGDGFETKKAREAKRVISAHCKAFGGTLDDAECMRLTGLARNTYYKYKRQIREEQEAAKSMRQMK